MIPRPPEDGRDLDYVCWGCNGNIVLLREENGRKIYICEGCHANELPECTICHKPRSIWTDDGDICAGCGLRWIAGELSLTPSQIAGIEKYRVVLG